MSLLQPDTEISKTKSPLKSQPRRRAGSSQRRLFEKTFLDRVMFPIMSATFAVMLAVMEWAKYFLKLPPSSVIYTLLALGMIAFAWWRWTATEDQLMSLEKGRKGEEAVADVLEELREMGYRVLHDLPDSDASGRQFNIDHVIVGPAGVFVIETKYRSKPPQGQPHVRYDGVRVLVNGNDDSKAVVQARACADSVRRLLRGDGVPLVQVRAVVVYPGWYVEKCSGAEVWVLEPKMLWAWLRQEAVNQSEHLSRETITRICTCLERVR